MPIDRVQRGVYAAGMVAYAAGDPEPGSMNGTPCSCLGVRVNRVQHYDSSSPDAARRPKVNAE